MSGEIYHLVAVIVMLPLKDGDEASETNWGYYSSLEKAREALPKMTAARVSPEDGELLLQVNVTAWAVDEEDPEEPSYRGVTGLCPTTGEVLGDDLVADDEDLDEPWAGRDPATCKWKVGDEVAVIYLDTYRIGTIAQLPPSPEVAQQTRLDVSEDAYLVDFPDGDHCHPREWQILPPR